MKVDIYTEVDKQAAISLIEKLNLSKKYVLEIKVKKEKRSLDQNALYWLWLTCIQHESGNDKDFLHDFFREKYLPYREIEVFGKLMKELTSTTKLSRAQFKEYLYYIQIFASVELGVVLPNPEDLHFEQFKNFYQDRL